MVHETPSSLFSVVCPVCFGSLPSYSDLHTFVIPVRFLPTSVDSSRGLFWTLIRVFGLVSVSSVSPTKSSAFLRVTGLRRAIVCRRVSFLPHSRRHRVLLLRTTPLLHPRPILDHSFEVQV